MRDISFRNRSLDFQAFDWASILQMFADDFFKIFPVDIGVPGAIRVDNCDRAFLTTPHAASAIDAHTIFSSDSEFLAERLCLFPEFSGVKVAATGFARLSLVNAYEKVTFIVSHGFMIKQKGRLSAPFVGRYVSG